eukprot:5874636-Prymnesium_polylepis.1
MAAPRGQSAAGAPTNAQSRTPTVPAAVDRRLTGASRGHADKVPRRVPEVAVGGACDARHGALAQHGVAAGVDDPARVDLGEAAHLEQHRVGREVGRDGDHVASFIHRDEAHLGPATK